MFMSFYLSCRKNPLCISSGKAKKQNKTKNGFEQYTILRLPKYYREQKYYSFHLSANTDICYRYDGRKY